MFGTLTHHFGEITRRLLPSTLTTPTCDECGDTVGRYCFVSYDLPVQILCFVCAGEHYELNAGALFTELKRVIGCETCGFCESRYAIDGAHIDPTKKYRTKAGKLVDPSDLFRFCSLKTGNNELNNMRLLCKNHHTIETMLYERQLGI
jgi:hypothetical protein